jgi:hypothetical protein
MTDNGELERRLRQLEDRADLWELVSRYAVAVDDEDYGALEKMFAVDGEFIGSTGVPSHGRQAVADYLRERASVAHRDRVHTPTSQIIEHLARDTARGVVCGYAALFGRDGSDSFFSFRYADQYLREGGRWCFQSRRVHAVTHLQPA